MENVTEDAKVIHLKTKEVIARELEAFELQEDSKCVEEINAILKKYRRDMVSEISIRSNGATKGTCVIVRTPKQP